MTKDDDCERWASFEGTTVEGSRSAAEDEDEAPVLDPEYGDLLDEQWLGRESDALDPEDDLVDIGLTIDMSGADEGDEAHAMELDVGALLTSLPGHDLESADHGEPVEREPAADGELHGLLLPEERGHSREDDEAVGDDERFPAFEGVAAPVPAAPLEDDAEGPREA